MKGKETESNKKTIALNHTLSYGHTHVELSASGELLNISSYGASVCFSNDSITLTINGNGYHMFPATLVSDATLLIEPKAVMEAAAKAVPCRSISFVKKASEFEALLQYEITNAGFLKRSIRVVSLCDSAVFNRLDIALQPVSMPKAVIPYDTFWNAPTCVFVRSDGISWITGFENPFFQTEFKRPNIQLWFEPALVLSIDETCKCEDQFIIPYVLSGKYTQDHPAAGAFLNSKREGLDRYRFRNPSGHVPVDNNERNIMRRYVEEYLETPERCFIQILYFYWYPIRQMPETDDEFLSYKHVLDQFVKLGGSHVIFNPLHRYPLPGDGEDGYWELAPDGSCARRILEYADSAGLKYGFYMGVAAHGEYGNACSLPFRKDRRDYKKLNIDGSLSDVNCLGSDEYLKWWLSLHECTIDKNRLSVWCWDPGPGNGNHCYSTLHGHLPGKGAYKGWQNSQRLLKRLREQFPDLYLMSYYGRKEYGPWGFKYFDQQEGYWEQTPLLCCSLHPDLHDDRFNAHGVRLQNYWNQALRFLPPQINHAPVHRIGENYYNKDYPALWDREGWRFALLSSIAASGSITLVLLPEYVDTIDGMREFYAKWTGWAQAHIGTVNNAIPFGGQVEAGKFDGVARITENRGFIFLFNASSLPVRAEFALDNSIGYLQGDASLTERWPDDGAVLYNEKRGDGRFSAGDIVTVELEPYSSRVYELVDPICAYLYGLPGEGYLKADTLIWTAPECTAGIIRKIYLSGAENAVINGRVFKSGSWLSAGAYSLQDRAQTTWYTEDGRVYPIFANTTAEKMRLRSELRIENGLQERLGMLAQTENPEQVRLALRWLNKEDGDYFHNNLWAFRSRALLVVYTRTTCGVDNARLWIDGSELNVCSFTLDGLPLFFYAAVPHEVLTQGMHRLDMELDNLKPGQFMGTWFETEASIATDGFCETGPPVYPLADAVSEALCALPSPYRITKAVMRPKNVSENGEDVCVTAYCDTRGKGHIKALYLENATLPSMKRMTYSDRFKRWEVTDRVGKRSGNIMDSENFYIWGIDGEGKVLPRKPLAFNYVKECGFWRNKF